MKITIFTIGTRGDVQPYAVLGQALAERGHDVTVSTARNYAEFIQGYGVKFHPVDVDYEEILKSEEGRKILQVNIMAIQRNLDTHIYPLIKKSLDEFYKLAKSSDLIIYRPKTMADVFTDHLNVKAISAAVIPAMEETTAFLNPMFSGFNLPSFLNKLSYKINRLRYKLLYYPIKQFRKQNGLEKTPVNKQSIPCVYGISPSFLERPADWSEEQHLTGFWFPKSDPRPDQELEEFLNQGKTPLVITFGSMPFKKDISPIINFAIENLDERFIIVKGWGNWNIDNLNSPRLKIIENANFEWLFPKVKAVIHHGGIGTIAECLRAGKPMLICPVLYPVGDHTFWADLVFNQGLGVKPTPLSKMTPKIFVEKIKILLTDELLYNNAEQMSYKINAENGVAEAVRIIEEKYLIDQGTLDPNALKDIA